MTSSLLVMPVREDWNRMGPPIPLWFRETLRKLDPTLVLQFIPPSDRDPKGMDAARFPHGGWQICRKMKNGWLHKMAVYSLMDRFGRYAPPTPELIKLLRYAKGLWDSGEFNRLQEEFDRSIFEIRQAAASKTKEDLIDAVHKFLSFHGNRQFHNRIFFKDCLSGG